MPTKKLKFNNVLWLTPPNFSGGLESLLKKYIREAGLDFAPIRYRCLTQGCMKRKTKTKWTWDNSKYEEFEYQVIKQNPDFIVVNDSAALGFLTQQYTSLALTRGSIYKWKNYSTGKEIPVLVIDAVQKTKSVNEGAWVLTQDLHKLKRWIMGEFRHQPAFSYTVISSRKEMDELVSFAENSILISEDIETSGQGHNVMLTCTGFSCWNKNGKLHTWVLPFINSTVSGGAYWKNEKDEIYMFEQVKKIHASKAYKVMQNGSYDSAHFISYRLPVYNYVFDTLHLFHSLWAEAPKRLDFISSVCLDFYRFWKDEGKEDEKNDAQKTKVPQTEQGLREYWRYNALDCYYTLVDCIYLLGLYSTPQLNWAKDNYIKEFRQQTGPALAGSLRGCKWNRKIQNRFNEKLTKEWIEALDVLQIMVNNSNFNPNSPKDMPELIYSILNAEQIPRQKRTTGEEVLKLIQTQHPLYKRIIDQIWKVKKPRNNASKYGQLKLMHERFMYKLSAAGTETWRYATKSSDFWRGSNVQNVPEPMRVIFESDKNYILFDFDYSQSDAYFTAFESEDSRFMETMLSPHDTHCIHAAHFFKIGFEVLAKAKENHESWCVHKVTGVRSVTKRVVYGANYLMTAYTLFITMGQDAVVAAAKHLGYEDADSWNHKQLVYLCDKFLDAYFEMYPMLHPWLAEQVSLGKQNGNIVKTAEGNTRIFFGNLSDNATKRKLASFFGQNGTAANINKFMDDFYYNDGLFKQQKTTIKDSDDIMFLFQVHDSVVGQVHKDKLHLLSILKKQMERKNTIHGRTFVVPVEGQVGFGWGKRMLDWHEGITYDEIKEYENNWWKKWNQQ